MIEIIAKANVEDVTPPVFSEFPEPIDGDGVLFYEYNLSLDLSSAFQGYKFQHLIVVQNFDGAKIGYGFKLQVLSGEIELVSVETTEQTTSLKIWLNGDADDNFVLNLYLDGKKILGYLGVM